MNYNNIRKPIVSTGKTPDVPRDVNPKTAEIANVLDRLDLIDAAMSKEEFFKNAEDRKAFFNNSGFINLGKHYNIEGTNINEGLWEFGSVADQWRLGMGRGKALSNTDGTSKTFYPIALADGITHHIRGVANSLEGMNEILFPPAPDGTEVYDEETGELIKFATSNQAFEGLLENGDFRTGNASGWTHSGTASLSIVDGFLRASVPSDANVTIDNHGQNNMEDGVTYRLEVYIKDSSKPLSFYQNSVKTNYKKGKNVIEFTYHTGDNIDLVLMLNAKAGDTIDIYAVSLMKASRHVVETRQDLTFIETFFERVTDKDLITNGSIQSFVDNYNGVTLSKITDLGIDQSYCAFGEWDTYTIGYGVKWSTLNKENRLKFISDPTCNIYYDYKLDDFVQARYRIRTIKGLGDKWDKYRCDSADYGIRYQEGKEKSHIRVRGESLNSKDYLDSYSDGVFISYNSSWNNIKLGDYGCCIKATAPNNMFPVYYLPLALTQRLNQGCYHPSYNPFGTGYVRHRVSPNSSAKWVDTNVKHIHCTAHAFWFGESTDHRVGDLGPYAVWYDGTTRAIGDIQSGYHSRMFGDIFYDSILAYQVKDLRITAHRRSKDDLLRDIKVKSIRGDMRGWEGVPKLEYIGYGATDGAMTDGLGVYSHSTANLQRLDGKINGIDVNKFVEFNKCTMFSLTRESDRYTEFYNIYGSNDNYVVGSYIGQRKKNGDPFWIAGIGYDASDIIITLYSEPSPRFAEIEAMEIYGTPSEIMDVFGDGVLGRWNPMKTSTEVQNWKLYKKAYEGTGMNYRTSNKGAEWSIYQSGMDALKNVHLHVNNLSDITLSTYKAKSKFTEIANEDSLKFIETLNEITFVSDYQIIKGNNLVDSILDKVSTEIADVYSFSLLKGKYSGYIRFKELVHEDIDNEVEVDGAIGLKVVFGLVEINGANYPIYIYREAMSKSESYTPWSNDSIEYSGVENIIDGPNGNKIKEGVAIGIDPINLASR